MSGWASFGYFDIFWCYAQCALLDSNAGDLHFAPFCKLALCSPSYTLHPAESAGVLVLASKIDFWLLCKGSWKMLILICTYIYINMWVFHLLLFVHQAAGKHLLFLYVLFLTYWLWLKVWGTSLSLTTWVPAAEQYEALHHINCLSSGTSLNCLNLFKCLRRRKWKPSVWCWIFIPILCASWSLDAF